MRPARLKQIYSVTVLLVADLCFGTTLRVPQSFPSIQNALDASAAGDTILVAVGTYIETLRAPAWPFILKGDVVPDTGEYPRPILDPDTLPRFDTLACLILPPRARATIEDFTFRNSAAVHDTLDRFRPGGIIYTSGDSLWLRRCVMDSVISGIFAPGQSGGFIHVEDCHFENCVQGCLLSGSPVVYAEESFFSGQGLWMMVLPGYSHLNRCYITDNQNGHLLTCAGDSIWIRNCFFGRYGPHIFSPITLAAGVGCVIEDNLFADSQLGLSILDVSIRCGSADSTPVVIRNNTFTNYQGVMGQGGMALHFLCQQGETGYFGQIEGNTFAHGFSNISASASGMEAFGSASVSRNRFTDMLPPSVPIVQASHINQESPDTLVLRDNIFEPVGLAAATYRAAMDARWNWWGDSSGPYHATQNPGGSGAEITGNVQFIPWHTDTAFIADAPERDLPLPQSAVTVYPNPFNSRTTLAFELSRAGQVEVVVYDVVGRQVDVLLDGPQPPGRHVLTFGNDSLPSGLYFCHLTAGSARATAKLVLLR